MLLASCGDGSRVQDSHETTVLDDRLRVEATFDLEEDEADPIGDIGIVVEARNGDVLVGDAILPRIRRYSPAGALASSFGAYGQGPWELLSVRGVFERRSGEVVLIDPRQARVTVLTPDLRPDTLFSFAPSPLGPAVSVEDGAVLLTATGNRSANLTAVDPHWRVAWSRPAPAVPNMFERPYWSSFATPGLAQSPVGLLASISFLYPIEMLDDQGRTVASVSEPPPSFRTASAVEAGAFSGTGGMERLERWFASFDVIARIDVVSDSILAVTRGHLYSSQGSLGGVVHDRLDFYHLPSLAPLALDVPLPAGAKVLTGGRGLYVLLTSPPEPWRIAKLHRQPTADHPQP
jgi:hypothetical protein